MIPSQTARKRGEVCRDLSESIRKVEKPESEVRRIPDTGYQGLCMNCENRASCMYASKQGGVWHCEEYR